MAAFASVRAPTQKLSQIARNYGQRYTLLRFCKPSIPNDSVPQFYCFLIPGTNSFLQYGRFQAHLLDLLAISNELRQLRPAVPN